VHEYAIVSSLVEAVDEQARRLGAGRVLSINLLAGERSGIEVDSASFYLDMLAQGTLVAGARLNIRRVPMRFRCERCGSDYAPPGGPGAVFACPRCGSVGQLVDDGSGLLIDSIEIETGSEAGGA
jgi:hydrogenase nickel incorporation protein HypA/HybF